MTKKNWQKVEISNPQFERDGLRHITFKSAALKRRGDVTVFVPPAAKDLVDLPLILLLHGVYGSHWAWAFSGGAHLTAQKLISEKRLAPCVLVMPSDGLWGDGSGYLTHSQADHENWIMQDVIGCAQESIDCLSADSKCFISGLSMGGYGALRLGAKYAGRFSAISAHSAVTTFTDLFQFIEETPETMNIAQPEIQKISYWLEKNRDILPPLRFDCGLDDYLLAANQKLHAFCLKINIPHTYREFPGDHNWDYWQLHLIDTLLFFNQYF